MTPDLDVSVDIAFALTLDSVLEVPENKPLEYFSEFGRPSISVCYSKSMAVRPWRNW